MVGGVVVRRVVLRHGPALPYAEAGGPGGAPVVQLEDPVSRELAERFVSGLTEAPVGRGFLETVVEESLKAPAYVWRETLRGLLETDLRATLAGILVPTLVVRGDRDPVLTPEDQQTMLDAVPGARLIVHEGAGHVVHWERPARVARDIAAFTATVMR
ncbi:MULTISPECIES: alpha/beta hydrolase [unclassified Streptomyces]|uniref:alpha/beta fold hydrolase n=1 Tax=unclassified Streptomyces TaxID=2593676 RepID=UPI0006FF61CE|nr:MULTISPECIES: alpha/beta hydrolase [unclassified Streptomyces]KQX49610.1 hypothetical protein ASD33_17985 [Streptomyces sp. Root1304]KRA79230.1 hypothetical protein ASE09_22505 [Streptomyces sp. Root66D1]